MTKPLVQLAVLVDDLLEASVVASFTRLGPAIRRRLFRWRDPARGALVGRTVLVTGPTSGLGRATALALADLGAAIALVGRDPEKLQALREELIDRHGEDRFRAYVADLSSLASVRAVASEILAAETHLDVLVDNAGAIFGSRRETDDGLEATLALLVVGPFVLTAALLPLLRRTPGSLVIAVASGGMYAQPLALDDLQLRARPYDGVRAYARAKRAQVALMREWARRERSAGVTFTAMHPGWADTPGLAASLPAFRRVIRPLLRTAGEGIETIVWLAASAPRDAIRGRLFLDRRPRPFDRLPSTRLRAAERRRLWDLVVGLSGAADPAPGSGSAADAKGLGR